MELKPQITSMIFACLLGVVSYSATASSFSAGYWYDNEGQLIHDNEGDCVRTAEWNPGNATAQCDPELFRHAAKTAKNRMAGSTLLAEASAKNYPSLSATRPQNENVTLYGDASFGFGKSTLTARDMHNLDRLIARVKSMPEVATIHVTGYTDNVGSPEYNMKLSLHRAEAAQQYLVAHGIDPKRIVIVGKGEAGPAATNATPAGRAGNRRVEIKIRTVQKLASSY